MDTKVRLVEAISERLREWTRLGKKELNAICNEFGIVYNDNIGIVKESVEISLMHIAREIAQAYDFETAYAKIIELYNIQPILGDKMTLRQMALQQYSTSLPLSFLMSNYICNNQSGIYFEPTAGNGFLTIALPQEQTIVNEIDGLRLENLKGESYRKVTEQDATKPFDFGKIFDGVVMNPPFLRKGMTEAIIFNSLACMKDSGKCAILRDGWNEFKPYYGTMQRSKLNPFFDELFWHYNVEKIINLKSTDVYAKQGTITPMQIILLNGRKSVVKENMMHRVFNPEIDITELQDFDGFYKIFASLKNKNKETLKLQDVEMKLL